MTFGDDEEIGETEPAPVPAATNASRIGRVPVKINAPAPSFIRSPIEASSRSGQWSGESDGAAAPMHSKRTVYLASTETQAFVEIVERVRAHIRRGSRRQANVAAANTERISGTTSITGTSPPRFVGGSFGRWWRLLEWSEEVFLEGRWAFAGSSRGRRIRFPCGKLPGSPGHA